MKINEIWMGRRSFSSCHQKMGMMSSSPHQRVERHHTLKKLLFVMKLTTLILMLFLIQVSAASKAQITLNENRASLQKVLKSISRQSGYDLIYSVDDLKNASPVNVKLVNGSVEKALELCFAGQPLVYQVSDRTVKIQRKEEKGILERIVDYFQSIEVTGKITGENGEALVGATIKIKGTTKSTTSDAEGKFTLKSVEDDAMLEISFLGYESKEVKATAVVNVSLKIATAALEEVAVVSTGYQTLPKERATGSFVQINKELYNEQVGTNVLSRLESIVNGLSVFRNDASVTSQLMVRGLSTINGPTSPLIILDNFPYEGNINNINPNDVESITVLKDAAAASIWGTKAGNGVVVITTKKGKYNQALSIEINSNLTIGAKPNLNYLTPMSSADYIGFEQFLFGKGFYNDQVNNNLQYPVLSPVVELLAKHSKGEITLDAAMDKVKALSVLDVRNNFSNLVYKTSSNQQYYLNIRGGATNLAYGLSVGYDHNTSVLEAQYNRLNLKSEATLEPVKGLRLTMAVTYTTNDEKSGKTGYSLLTPMFPYQMLADGHGNPLPYTQTYGQSFKERENLKGQLQDWNYYPLTDYENSVTNTNTSDLLANFGANFKILKSLNFDVKYQFEKQQINGNTLNDKKSYFARNLINNFSQVDGNNLKYNIPVGGIMDKQTALLRSHNLRAQLNFNKAWDRHSVSILAGQELRSLNNTSNTYRTYGYNGDILTSASVDYKTQFPNYATKNNAVIPYLNNFGSSLYRFLSFYLNGAYTFDDKYTVSGSLRRDASNLFGVETNDKWTPLWSSGIGWELSKEKFYGIKALSYLKLRATLGYSGNVDPSKSAVTTISYMSANSVLTNLPVAQISNFYNPDLRWEKVRTLNIGVDFKVKGDRITGNLEYYQKKATDLYATVPIDYTAGLGTPTLTKNAAAMKGSGIDIEINSINTTSSLRWTTTLNFNYYKDEVLQYYLSTTNGSNYVSDSRYPIKDFPVWGVYSYKWGGLDNNGNPQGYINGQPSTDYALLTGSGTQVSDLVYNGPRFPVISGSLGNTFSYKQFSLSTRITYGFGSYFRRQSVNYSLLANSKTGANADYSKRWLQPGDENQTIVPSIVYPLNSARDDFYSGVEPLVQKGDVIRLQYVTLSYNFSRKQFSGLPFRNLQLFLNANNVGIIWRANKFSIDPDYTYTNTTMPTPKSFSFGLKVNL